MQPVNLTDAALFLDLDGTLTPLMPLPDQVGPDLYRNGLLRRSLRALNGRLAVVSGRPLNDVDRILEGVVTCVSGSHGLQRRTASLDVISVALHPRLEEARRAALRLNERYPDLVIEDKPHGIALHFRTAPDLEYAAAQFADRWATSLGLTLQPGNKVFELRTPGPTKGDAVRTYLSEAPFKGHVPIFIGDDLTDEDGFRAAKRAGGYGIRVGSPVATTEASVHLPSVADVLDWLEASIDCGCFDPEGRAWAA